MRGGERLDLLVQVEGEMSLHCTSLVDIHNIALVTQELLHCVLLALQPC